jgi:hypothetical protein
VARAIQPVACLPGKNLATDAERFLPRVGAGDFLRAVVLPDFFVDLFLLTFVIDTAFFCCDRRVILHYCSRELFARRGTGTARP